MSLDPEEEDEKDVKKEKTKSIRKLVMMALEAVRQWTEHAADNPKFV